MSMLDWAKEEINLVCKREIGSKQDSFDGYGEACYKSALKAFESLMEDGHSGVSILLTKNILLRLIDGQPLTAIEDVPEIWGEGEYNPRRAWTTYQCKRMSSLFKYLYDDGRIEYWDVNRYYCQEINSGATFTGSTGRQLIDELYPITMPYWPTKPYKVICEEFLTNPANGDFDTVGILQIIEPDGTQVMINRYYKEAEVGFEEIDQLEYRARVIEHEARLEMAEALN